jgi:hypothetical protein
MSRAGRGLARALVLSLCVVVCGAVAGVGPAFAAGSFGEAGSGAGQFFEPLGIAVEQESGDVYVVDHNNARVDKFGPGGEFLLAWGWGVADGHTEALQTCTSSCFAGVRGGGSGEFRGPEGVAVDNDPLSASYGDVYVVDNENYRVEKFDSSGGFLLMFGGEVNATSTGDVCLAGEACQAGVEGSGAGRFVLNAGDRIAVDSAGTVLVGDRDRVEEFGAGGAFEGQIALPGAGRVVALAVDSSGNVYVEGSELDGVHKYDGAGVELGEPRDPSIEQPFAGYALVVGPSDELFVDDGQGPHHLLEFAAGGAELARFDAGPEGGFAGLAFGVGADGLYVLERGAVRLVAPPVAGPLLISASDAASGLQPTTATLNATVNAEGRETSYHFEYGTSTAYGVSTAPGALPAGFEDVPVSAEVGGLLPRTTYHFRVVASNSAGTFLGPDETFRTLPPVLIDSESVSQVTSDSAVLAAQIDPLGVDTRYRLEYGSTNAYGTSVPAPDGDAGSGKIDYAVSAPIGGLSAGAVYHYRVVAHNALGTVEGPDRVFTTQAAQQPLGLLDGRAWEMVSPPDKHGAVLEGPGSGFGGLIEAARDGGAISYLATGPVDGEPAGNRSLAFTQVLSRRGAGGWASRGIATANEAPAWSSLLIGGEYRLFSDDLSVGLVEPEGDTPLSPAASERTPYLQEADGEYTPLVTAANVPSGTKFGSNPLEGLVGVVFRGASPDLSHVVLSSQQALTPNSVSSEGPQSLYEWAAGSLRLVSVLPNGRPAAEEGQEARLGKGGYDVRHAVSDDGSRVVWSTETGEHHLYVSDMHLEKSVQLDVVEGGAQGGEGEGAVFQTASSDGSKVFFTDTSKLTLDAVGHGGQPDLYMCEVDEAAGRPTCTLEDLTVDENRGEEAHVWGVVLGAGEDGRYVYFAADGALAPGATPGNCATKEHITGYVPGAVCNLYVYDTVTGGRRLVAVLSNEDDSDWEGSVGGSSILSTVKVSPSGRYLGFMSQRSLTGYDNIDARSGQPDAEVFLYNASSGAMVCASCNPTGARPAGVFDTPASPGLLVDHVEGSRWNRHWLAGSIPGWEDGTQGVVESWYQPGYLSDRGRLFFNAADALVPQDTNGLEDVYEYEPSGVGDCAVSSGCVGLISSGTSGEESVLLDASESGDDVFFMTTSRLVGQDTDSGFDVYDARVCTASSPCVASVAASSPASCASGDACRGPGSPQSQVFGAPSSTAASAAGNLTVGALAKPAAGKRASQTRKLAGALRTCRKKAKRKQRVSCETRARRLYGKGARAKNARGAGATRKGSR